MIVWFEDERLLFNGVDCDIADSFLVDMLTMIFIYIESI